MVTFTPVSSGVKGLDAILNASSQATTWFSRWTT
jgi:hypothetical protein